MKVFFKTRKEMREFTKGAVNFKPTASKDSTKVRGGQWPATRVSQTGGK